VTACARHRAPTLNELGPIGVITDVPARRWVLLIGTLIGTAGLLLLAAASVVFCEGAVRVPKQSRGTSRAAPGNDYPGAVWRTVHIRAQDGIVLEGWFVRPAGDTHNSCALLLHGIADSKSGAAGFAPMLLAGGYSVLLPDSRAHGNSEGEFVTYGLLEKQDVLEWTRWLRGNGCDRIYGLGESLGASVLIQASAMGPAFRAIVAECPYADLKAMAAYRVRDVLRAPRWISAGLSQLIVRGGMIFARLRYGLDFDQVSPVLAMAQSKTPVLLIHGTQDEQTPYWHSQRLAAANTGAVLWLVPGAGHVGASAADPEGFRARVLGWFRQH